MEELNPGATAALGGLLGGIILGFAARAYLRAGLFPKPARRAPESGCSRE